MSIVDRPPSPAEEAAEGHGFARPSRTDTTPFALQAEAQAQEAGRETLWCVHVLGPGDVYAAPNVVTAARWAAALNEAGKLLNQDVTDDDFVVCHANVEPWHGSAEDHAANLPQSVALCAPKRGVIPAGQVVEIEYTNHKGKRAVRKIKPTGRMLAGLHGWHPDAPWLIEARDVERGVMRTFDPAKIHRWGPAALSAHGQGAPSSRLRAQDIVDDPRVLAGPASTPWFELDDECQGWIAAIVSVASEAHGQGAGAAVAGETRDWLDELGDEIETHPLGSTIRGSATPRPEPAPPRDVEVDDREDRSEPTTPEADPPRLCACGVYADRCDAPACGACEIEANYPPGSFIDLNEELRGYWA